MPSSPFRGFSKNTRRRIRACDSLACIRKTTERLSFSGASVLSRLREQLSSNPLLDEIASKIGSPTDFENRGPYEFFWWDSSTDTLRQFHTMRSVKDDIGNPAIQPGKLWIMSNIPGATFA